MGYVLRGNLGGKRPGAGRPAGTKIPIQSRFWTKVADGENCWEWLAACNNKGYGVIGLDGHQWLAHRMSWILCVGEIPAGLLVLHRCDNPLCVNPEHLYLGTPRENGLDRAGRPFDQRVSVNL